MIVDVGTGDGAHVLRLARERPQALVIGIDANADALREASARATRKPSRGGVTNVIFARLALEEMPGDLEGLATELTVLLPWGSLLRAVAAGEVSTLRRTCRAGARVRVVFGYGAEDGTLGLPAIDRARLEAAYRHAGFEVTCRPLADIGSVSTTWAKKLAFSGKARPFVELAGTVVLQGE